MKKIILFFALFGSLLANAYTIDLTHIDISRDTSFVIEHPNSNDSILAVNIINGIVQVLPVQATFFKALATPENVGALVGFIFFLWRLIEKRKLRKKNILQDSKWRKTQTILALFLCLNFNASASVPLDSVLLYQKQASANKIALSTFMTVKEYSKMLNMYAVPNDSIKAWKKQASSFKLDLNTYMECLIYSKNASSGVGGSGTVGYIPKFSSATTLTNSILSMPNSNSLLINSSLDGSGANLPNLTYSLSVAGGFQSNFYSSLGSPTMFAFYTNSLKKSSIFENYGYLSNTAQYRWSVLDDATLQPKFWVDLLNNGDIGIGNGYFVPTKKLDVHGTFQSYINTTSSLIYDSEFTLNGLNGGFAGGSYLKFTAIAAQGYNLIRSSGNLGISGDGTYANIIIKDNGSLNFVTKGSVPTSPSAGDTYSDGTHIYCYLAGSWKQLDN